MFYCVTASLGDACLLLLRHLPNSVVAPLVACPLQSEVVVEGVVLSMVDQTKPMVLTM